MALVDTIGETTGSDSLEGKGPNLRLVSSEVVFYGLRDEPTTTSESPGNKYMAMGVSPTEVDHAHLSSHDFEQWFLDIPANTYNESAGVPDESVSFDY